VSLSGKGTLVDSFDSGVGPYGSANQASEANVFSNGGLVAVGSTRVAGDVRSALGGVTIDKNGTVMGNVRAGTTIATAGTIEGTATPNAQSPPIAAPTVAACSPFSDASGISGKFTYNAATGDLTVSGGNTVTLADGAYCFHKLTLSGGSSLTVSGPVSIVVTDKIDASGGGFANTTRIPANLQISNSYSGTGGMTLSGGSGSYMNVYPPRMGIALSGGSAVYGALLGKTLVLSGGTAVHYDCSSSTCGVPTSISEHRTDLVWHAVEPSGPGAQLELAVVARSEPNVKRTGIAPAPCSHARRRRLALARSQ
jgi:hypothetical protein